MMLPFHDLANIFPIIEGEQFDKLSADIRDNGLRDKIVLLDGKILDGRNRYRAGLVAEVVPADGVGPCFRQYDPETDGADPLKWVISKNLTRRHLNDDQRRMVAARLVTMGRGRPAAENPAECGIKVPEAAQLVNTDAAGTERARTVQAKGTPELQAAVDHGKLSVAAAAQATKLKPEQQAEVAKLAEQGKANVVRTVIKKGVRDEREKALGAKQVALPQKLYGVILADPEHRFDVWSRDTGLDRAADNHYPTTDQHMLMAREVQKIAAKDCMCALWVTDLARGVRMLESWGFEYKSYFVWVKDIVVCGGLDFAKDEGESTTYYRTVGPAGTGYWNRDRDELLLIGTRGDFPAPAMGTQGESVWFAARPRLVDANRGRHSAKPENAHLWIEKHWPSLPKIEMNARSGRAGWDTWGNEAPDGCAEVSATKSEDAPALSTDNDKLRVADEPAPAVKLPSVAEILAAHPKEPRWKSQFAEPLEAVDLDATLPDFMRRQKPA